jgi:hypothetical protein
VNQPPTEERLARIEKSVEEVKQATVSMKGMLDEHAVRIRELIASRDEFDRRLRDFEVRVLRSVEMALTAITERAHQSTAAIVSDAHDATRAFQRKTSWPVAVITVAGILANLLIRIYAP